MATVLDEMIKAFIASAVKIVAPNDVAKKAYVPTAEQRAVLAKAGYLPVPSSADRRFPIVVSDTGQVLQTTYYDAYLGVTNRRNEPRMGRGLINWVATGDELLLGTDGKTIFARKITADDRKEQSPAEVETAVDKLYRKLDPKRLLERAEAAVPKPPTVSEPVLHYARDAAVRELVLRRCNGTCEVPGCGWTGFAKDDGSLFVEVHHIKPLSEGGEDTIYNTAGICPNCHRQAHYGANRSAIAASLRKTVAATTDAFKLSIGVGLA